MPNSFSRIATFLSQYRWADCRKSLGMVKSLVISISSRLAARDIEILHLTQIGLDHLRIVLNFVWRPVSNLPPKVQRHDPMGNIHDDTHVVLDQNAGRL